MNHVSTRLVGLLALLMVFASCSGEKIIPRDDMAEIYAEMFLRDQWIMDHPKYRPSADTSLVYEPVLKDFGYSVEEYNRSMEHYIQDPDRYARILRHTNQILDRRIKDLQHRLAIQKTLEAKEQEMSRYRVSYEMFYDRISCPDSVVRNDSVIFFLDSTVCVFDYNPELRFDTLYAGPELVFPEDTVAVIDTAALALMRDSLRQSARQVKEMRPLRKYSGTVIHKK